MFVPAMPGYDAGEPEVGGVDSGQIADLAETGDREKDVRDDADTFPWWWTQDAGGDADASDVSDKEDRQAPPDVEEPDTAELPWDCLIKTPEELGGGTVYTGSFSLTNQKLLDFPATENILGPNWFTCGLPDANDFYQDHPYVVAVDRPTEMKIALQCNGPCYAYTLQGGCMYQYLEQCWYNGTDDVTGSTWVLPGYHVIVVEFFYEPDVSPTDYRYDMQVALNHVDGQEECKVEEAARFSEMEFECPPGTPEGATATMAGDLTLEDGDDFYIDCKPGVEVDPFGGMADEAYSFTADDSEVFPGEVTVRLTRQSPGDGGAPLMLALSMDPCGAQDSILACVSGTEETLELPAATLFPGQTVHAIVDGVAGAAVLPATVAYQITWTVQAPCAQKTP